MSISGAARATPFAIALRSLQREMVRSDPAWRGGNYEPGRGPRLGLRLARKLGTITYRSPEEWQQRFGRRRVPETAGLSGDFRPQFEVEAYLEHQALRFADTFDANAYLYLSRAMDQFDLADHGGGSLAGGICPLRRKARARARRGDRHAVPDRAAARDSRPPARGWRCDVEYHAFPSLQGHDAFLTDLDRFEPAIGGSCGRDGTVSCVRAAAGRRRATARSLAWSAHTYPEEQRWIHHRAVDGDAPVQVRAGHAPGRADQPEHCPVSSSSPAFTSMRLRWQYIVTTPSPWSRNTVLPLKKKSPASSTRPGDGLQDRRAGRRGDVHAGMRIARLAVEEPSQPEAARARPGTGACIAQFGMTSGRVSPERRVDARALAVDALEVFLLRVHVALVRDLQALFGVFLRRHRELERAPLRLAGRQELRRLRARRRIERDADERHPAMRSRSTGARCSLKKTSPGASALRPVGMIAMPPGTRLSRGRSTGRPAASAAARRANQARPGSTQRIAVSFADASSRAGVIRLSVRSFAGSSGHRRRPWR